MASIPGGSAWSQDCVSMKKFINNRDLLLCLGDVNLRLTSWAFAAAFERAFFRVYILNSPQRLKDLMAPRQQLSPFLRHVRHLYARNLLGEFFKNSSLWCGLKDEYFTENVLDGLVSCSMDPYPNLLRSLSQYAPRLTVLDLYCNSGLGIDAVPSELCRFRGLKELSIRGIPNYWDEYVEAITTVLINSPNMETLRVMASEWGPGPVTDPCYESPGHCLYGLLPFICERFVEESKEGGRSLDGNERTNIPRLKLREVTDDHNSMNRFILDIPDSDLSGDSLRYTGNRQKPLYLEKLTDLQYLERFLEYACQVSLGRLEQFIPNSRADNLIFDWTDRVNSHDSLYTLLYLLKQPDPANSLRRLELNTPGDWTKLVPSLKDTLLHLRKLKYFHFHLAEYYPPLCLSLEVLKREKNFEKMAALAEDFFEVQPSLDFVEVNHFLYQVVRWGPGARDFYMVEILDREREWVAPEDTPWQGPEKDAVPFRMML
ncbi:hypothetical protein B0T13DRAFT_516824 [Neurospora crassa]|nr:hypothetical protein B0T13DRAFT_516824 [Neurospora crassa]